MTDDERERPERGPDAEPTPFHVGEQWVQTRLGVRDSIGRGPAAFFPGR